MVKRPVTFASHVVQGWADLAEDRHWLALPHCHSLRPQLVASAQHPLTGNLIR